MSYALLREVCDTLMGVASGRAANWRSCLDYHQLLDKDEEGNIV
jgi:hypothetical protein